MYILTCVAVVSFPIKRKPGVNERATSERTSAPGKIKKKKKNGGRVRGCPAHLERN